MLRSFGNDDAKQADKQLRKIQQGEGEGKGGELTEVEAATQQQQERRHWLSYGGCYKRKSRLTMW
jgi:hypothetical protein